MPGCSGLLILLEPTVPARIVVHPVRKVKGWRLFYHIVDPKWTRSYLGCLSVQCRWLPWDAMPTANQQVRHRT